MFAIRQRNQKGGQRLPRREFMRLGALGSMGLSLPTLLRAKRSDASWFFSTAGRRSLTLGT